MGPSGGSAVLKDNALSAASTTTQIIPLSGTATQDATAISVATSSASSTYGSPAAFTAALSYTCSGSVVFLDGGTTLGSVPFSGLTASYSTSALCVGNHNTTATYAAGGDCAAASSSAITETITRAAVTISKAASRNPSSYGDSITWTYTFTGSPHPIPRR